MTHRLVMRKRFGNLWFWANDLITPHSYMVGQVARRLGARSIHDRWDWVIRNIRYPFGDPAWNDTHQYQAFWRRTWFGRAPLVVYRQNDYWSYPDEVLRDGTGDCKDSAALLTSLLRRALGPDQVYLSAGWYHDHGQRHLHAWTTIFLPDGTPLALDTTYSRPLPPGRWVTESPHYVPIWRVNDQGTRILKPHDIRPAYGRQIRIVTDVTQASTAHLQNQYAGA